MLEFKINLNKNVVSWSGSIHRTEIKDTPERNRILTVNRH